MVLTYRFLGVVAFLGVISQAVALAESGPENVLLARPSIEPALEYRSGYWPEFVVLENEITSPRTGRKIAAGTRGVLIRVEDGEVVVDFGRNGVAVVSIDSTDLREQIALRETQGPRLTGIFAERMHNKFFWSNRPKNPQCLLQDFAAYEYFLLIYADVDGADWPAVVEAASLLGKNDAIRSRLLPVVLPFDQTEAAVIEGLRSEATAGLEIPVMFHFLAKSYFKTLHHQVSDQTTLALIDQNGRLVAREVVRSPETVSAFVNSLDELLSLDAAAAAAFAL